MCAPKIPAPPPPPDYAAATREGYLADIETLPQRRRIEAEAALGRGQFEGLGNADIANAILRQQLEGAPQVASGLLDIQRRFGVPFAEESRRQLQAVDPEGFALRQQFGGGLLGGRNTLEGLVAGSEAAPDYAAYVRNHPDLLANWENNTSKNTDLTIDQYGREHYEGWGRNEGRTLPTTPGSGGIGAPTYERVGNANLPSLNVSAREPGLLEIGDPEALRSTAQSVRFNRLSDAPALQSTARQVGLERFNDPEALRSSAQSVQFNRLGNAPELQSTASRINLERLGTPEALRSSAQVRDLERMATPEALRDAELTAYGRNALERQAYDELAQVGTLDPALRRAAEQAARARGSASGNILGDSSALSEALAVQLAQRDQDAQRRATALGVLSSGQTATDINARLGQQNIQNQAAALEQRNRSALGETDQELAVDAARNQALQQSFQNQASALAQRNTAAQAELENVLTLDEARNRALQQNFQNRATTVGQQNTTSQAELENALSLDAARNQALQQNIQNRASALSQRNTATQAELENVLTLDEARNRALQQNFQNRATTVGQQNAASQAELENVLSLDAARNQALQQNFQNRSAALTQRNTARQAGFENTLSLDAARNNAGQQAFNNLMNAIQQRNQSTQSEYGAKVNNVGLRSNARQQDLANIQSFLGLQPIVSQGGQLQGLQQGAAPFVTGQYQGVNLNPNAGAQGAGFAQNIFGTQTNQWNTQAGYAAQGGFLNTLGRIANIGQNLGSAYGSYTCHIAREVYGHNNPDWVRFYFWKEDRAPWWFRMAYNRWSEPIAKAIHPFPKLKAAIRAWMDRRINRETQTHA